MYDINARNGASPNTYLDQRVGASIYVCLGLFALNIRVADRCCDQEAKKKCKGKKKKKKKKKMKHGYSTQRQTNPAAVAERCKNACNFITICVIVKA